MSQPDRGKPIDPWTEWWWVTLPLLSRRIWPGLTMALVDGFYLAAYRPVATLASPLALSLGLAIGGAHLGFQDVFSESIPLMALAAVLGMLSAHLGALFVAGFALGDFFVAHRDWLISPGARGDLLGNLLYLRIPLLIEYGLLAMLAVGIPVASKGLLVYFLPPRRLGWPVRALVQTVVYTALVGVFVYLWTQATPFMMRPVFTWWGKAPTVDMARPLQFYGVTLVYFAVGAALARGVLEAVAGASSGLARRAVFVQMQLFFVAPMRAWYAPLGPWPPTLIRAAWATLMLGGILGGVIEGLLVFVLIAVLGVARAGLVPVPLGLWGRVVERVWLPLRLVAASAVVFVLAQQLLTNFAQSRNFFPMVMFTGLTLVITFLFMPGLRIGKAKRAAGEGGQPA